MFINYRWGICTKCANKCLKGATKQRLLALDGADNLYIYGTLYQNGLASSNFKISFDRLQDELKSTKELVAVLKEQNEVLRAQNEEFSQRLAVLEDSINTPAINFNRVVQEEQNKKDLLLKLLTLK